jgi:hypothetical protein
VFRRALAKSPSDRFASGAEMVAALRQALHTAAGRTRAIAPVPTAPTRVASAPRRPARSTASLWPLLLGGLAVAVLAGILLAAVLTRGDGSPAGARTVVHTVTARGTTIHETVTQPAPTQKAPTRQTTTAASPPPAADGHALNDQGFAKMQAGDYAGALPLLQQAVPALQGAGPSDPYEGYANYNLGYTLLQLGRCSEALTYLQNADRLEPHNKDVRRAIKSAERCGGGNGNGNGNGD